MRMKIKKVSILVDVSLENYFNTLHTKSLVYVSQLFKFCKASRETERANAIEETMKHNKKLSSF